MTCGLRPRLACARGLGLRNRSWHCPLVRAARGSCIRSPLTNLTARYRRKVWYDSQVLYRHAVVRSSGCVNLRSGASTFQRSVIVQTFKQIVELSRSPVNCYTFTGGSLGSLNIYVCKVYRGRAVPNRTHDQGMANDLEVTSAK